MTLVTTLEKSQAAVTIPGNRQAGGERFLLAIAVNCGFSPIAESQACETSNNSDLNLLI